MINRGDRHHRWAVQHVVAARETRSPLIVPEPVVGEAFTKLRYDKRVSPRRDAGPALTVLAMVDDNPDVFRVLAPSATAYGYARSLLEKYRDHAFSFVDALIFHMVDHHRSIARVLTVDGNDFRSYRFAGAAVEVVTP